MNFKEKYLKYKHKYLKLKGGNDLKVPDESSDEIYLVSWNVLNPNIEINKMTYNFYSNKYALDIAKVDNLRFSEFRIHVIVNIIDNLLRLFNNNIIICLQEVNNDLKNELYKTYTIETTTERGAIIRGKYTLPKIFAFDENVSAVLVKVSAK